MNRNVLVAILGVLLAGSLGYNAYQYSAGSKVDKGTQDAASVKLLTDSLIAEIKLLTDSVNSLSGYKEENARLTSTIEELEKRPTTVVQGGPSDPQKDATIAQLRAKIAELQALSAKATAVSANVTEKTAKGQKPTKKDLEEIAKIKEELAAAKKEAEDLRAQLAAVTAQRDAFEGEINANKGELDDLRDRVSKGAVPQYGTLMSSGIAKKGDQQVETFKAKGVEKLKITFDVLDNPLIREPIEEEVTIRIIGPEGDVLCSNPNLADKSKLYSIKTTIISDGEMHKVKWYYPPSGTVSKLKKGKYTTELWARGLMKQKNTFELN